MGLIQPQESTQGVVFLERDVVNSRQPLHTKIGRVVTFDLVHTDTGAMCVNVRLIRSTTALPKNLLSIFAPPLLVALATYLCVHQLSWPLPHSYIIVINLVSLIFVNVLARIPPSYRLRPADITVLVLSVAGGAAAFLVASLFVPTRLRTDFARFWLIVLIILHVVLIRELEPDLLARRSWKPIIGDMLPRP
jgi:Na+-transporting NADH:ubiquinone oxidoreductase subunit NqrB